MVPVDKVASRDKLKSLARDYSCAFDLLLKIARFALFCPNIEARLAKACIRLFASLVRFSFAVAHFW